jgi:hypothetical protein
VLPPLCTAIDAFADLFDPDRNDGGKRRKRKRTKKKFKPREPSYLERLKQAEMDKMERAGEQVDEDEVL